MEQVLQEARQQLAMQSTGGWQQARTQQGTRLRARKQQSRQLERRWQSLPRWLRQADSGCEAPGPCTIGKMLFQQSNVCYMPYAQLCYCNIYYHSMVSHILHRGGETRVHCAHRGGASSLVAATSLHCAIATPFPTVGKAQVLLASAEPMDICVGLGHNQPCQCGTHAAAIVGHRPMMGMSMAWIAMYSYKTYCPACTTR